MHAPVVPMYPARVHKAPSVLLSYVQVNRHTLLLFALLHIDRRNGDGPLSNCFLVTVAHVLVTEQVAPGVVLCSVPRGYGSERFHGIGP